MPLDFLPFGELLIYFDNLVYSSSVCRQHCVVLRVFGSIVRSCSQINCEFRLQVCSVCHAFKYLCRPTFRRIYKKKSTEGFQAIPYVVALFSAMLTLYYGLLKPDGVLLITINTIGILIESVYILLFMIYAPKDAKVYIWSIMSEPNYVCEI